MILLRNYLLLLKKKVRLRLSPYAEQAEWATVSGSQLKNDFDAVGKYHIGVLFDLFFPSLSTDSLIFIYYSRVIAYG